MTKTPKLRFPGFTDDWEQRKLGEVADVRDGTHNSPKYQGDGYPLITSKNVSNGFVNYNDIQYISSEDFDEINKRSKVEVNDILMGMIGTIGNLALIRTEPNFAIKNVALIKYINRVSYLYLYHNLQTQYVEKQILSGMDGGTQKFLSLKKIRELNILVPWESEQEAIGTFFRQLDELLTLHQRKLDDVKNLKQSLLQKMFPKNGEVVPEVRFPDFTNAWEQRKLGEVIYRSNKTSTSDKLPRLEYEDLNSGFGTLNKDISRKLDARKGLVFEEGEVLFGKLRPYLKNWWFAEFKGIALGDFWNLKSDSWNNRFLYTFVQSDSFQKVANDTSGTKMPRSDWKLVSGSAVTFPTLPEQEAIGTFFRQLDELLTLHQRKLEHLQSLKKSLLQQMFV